METKRFFEVFNTLSTDEDLRILFFETDVRKISVNHNKTLLRIYITSDHIIEKKEILRMERLMGWPDAISAWAARRRSSFSE